MCLFLFLYFVSKRFFSWCSVRSHSKVFSQNPVYSHKIIFTSHFRLSSYAQSSSLSSVRQDIFYFSYLTYFKLRSTMAIEWQEKWPPYICGWPGLVKDDNKSNSYNFKQFGSGFKVHNKQHLSGSLCCYLLASRLAGWLAGVGRPAGWLAEEMLRCGGVGAAGWVVQEWPSTTPGSEGRWPVTLFWAQPWWRPAYPYCCLNFTRWIVQILIFVSRSASLILSISFRNLSN